MRIALAAAALRRHGSRTLLAMLGVAVSAAMLLDMVMLATGMRESFRQLLTERGFDIRLAPRGTLPFDTEATIAGAAAIRRTLEANPAVAAVSPVLGTTVHIALREGAVSAFALGIDPAVQGDYELVEGRDALHPGAIVMSAELLRDAGLGIGDSVDVALGYDPQLRAFTGVRRLEVSGIARFLYLPVEQRAAALPLGTLQAMGGPEGEDRLSLAMVRSARGADVDSLRAWIERTVPRVTPITTREAIVQVDERLAYFRQLAYILGAVSLVVAFLLVTTLVTVSVNERLGEIAVMRAIGVSRAHVVQQIVLESLTIALVGAAGGLALGLVTARWLNSILARFPGLPEAIDFFLFQPRAVWTALGYFVLCGIAAAIYPAWRGAGLPIARTLRQEVVG